MHVLRGRADTPERDRARSRELLDLATERDSPHLRVWQPPRHVAFGRRDRSRPGYDRARNRLRDRNIPVIERSTGGHAVLFTGNTVSVVLATPIEEARSGITDRYERATDRLREALCDLGVDAEPGEPDGAFCPGTHSLSAEGKIVGLAQRIRQDVAVVAGIVVLEDHEEIAEVLGPVYDDLEIPFAADATGSIARAGGVTDAEAVTTAIETAFTDGDATVERV
ncbi:lipoate--protein ligase family protein [Halovenus sp. WSH3]|uniref:Lipoate--protein ligase family protein n=1 Tax=Halovenus carboxidivorans TaxID=2692199 RepID=A0A6B0T1T9_9EURY|nr:lipoate--protein ligase family protein [Halovenus carboxidivorans]MXR51945.1 lipoate--protein ligase family protein [Halovenus carboxidivorans]